MNPRGTRQQVLHYSVRLAHSLILQFLHVQTTARQSSECDYRCDGAEIKTEAMTDVLRQQECATTTIKTIICSSVSLEMLKMPQSLVLCKNKSQAEETQ